jgi:hypothetical protein
LSPAWRGLAAACSPSLEDWIGAQHSYGPCVAWPRSRPLTLSNCPSPSPRSPLNHRPSKCQCARSNPWWSRDEHADPPLNGSAAIHAS